MNEHTAAGKFDQVKGKIKQSVGEAVGNERLANSGAADEVKGAAKESWGNTKDAVHDIGDNAAANTRAAAKSDASAATRDTTAAGHDIRQKIVSTAENVKDSIKEKTDRLRHSA
jgi:uncharacterized protein YjbJ (UPF0337 family)